MVAETLVAGIGALSYGHDLVEESTSPDVAILNVVEAIGTAGDETVDLPRVAHLVVLAPIASQLQLGLLG